VPDRVRLGCASGAGILLLAGAAAAPLCWKHEPTLAQLQRQADHHLFWTYDRYHASTYGYYLEALVVFGAITGRDPRSLGDNECAAFELGLSTAQVAELQQVAFDELASRGSVRPNPLKPTPAGRPMNCPRWH